MEPDQSGNKFKISWLTWLMDLDIATYKALDYASQIAYSSKEVLRFTYSQAVKYRNSPGVYVECGVAAGAQIIAMAAGAPNKTIYAFDSFEGIPFPSNKDDQMPGIRHLADWERKVLPEPGHAKLESTGATSVSRDDYLEHLGRSGVNMGNIYSMKGWFEETIPLFVEENPDIEIAILRLDGDLYNSTLVCLQYLYPKLMQGGVCIIDDFALEGCQAAFRDYFPEDFRIRADIKSIQDKDSTVIYWNK